ncbi:MAG: transcriptional attenuator LytR family [Candidatus Saganbacteria bacterium]|uniref:Transcriptional attenuator LytR family n=1 Tax=Candidatus Saganbacteria bacterium TaxID=2575572 RepID=A0A833P3A8_UNCSA|nr:MAG: transcriptional attenuator LytR family [Candidatus Saganbacteria bacterium]
MKRRPDFLRLSAVIIVILGVGYLYQNLFSPKSIPDFLKLAVIETPENILILGTDITFDSETGRSTYEVGRSDTIMLLHYEPLRRRINILSIPRDSYVEIPGYYYTKINAAFVFGGIDLAKKTVSNITGVKIDKHIIINTQGLKKLVDLLGGVPVDVEKDMYYVDRAQDLHINLKKGCQKLSGKQAEGYIRFRHDAEGDIGRIARQQNFFKSLTKSLSTPQAFFKSPFIIGLILKNIKSSLSLKEFIIFANTMRQSNLNEINTMSLPGIPSNNEAGSVWLIDQNELKRIISEYF